MGAFHKVLGVRDAEVEAPLATLVLASALRQEQPVHATQRRLRLAKEHGLRLEAARPLGKLRSVAKHYELGHEEAVRRVACGALVAQAVSREVGEATVHQRVVVGPK